MSPNLETRILAVDPSNVFFRCVEDSTEAIMISNAQGVLVYVNPAWSRIYGYTQQEAVGKTPRLLHSGMQSDTFYREMWTKISDPQIGHWKGELINKAKDGSHVPVLLTITTVRGDGGEISGYMGIAVDLSYKRELESKIAHQDRLASIGILASGLAHEIGTPLGVVRGRAEYLMMQANDPGMRKNLEIITAQTDRISKLIRSLLRVSRSFSDVRFEAVNVSQIANEVITLVGQNLRQDSVEVLIAVDDKLCVRADSGRLEQVLLNFVMNSIHAIRKAIHTGRDRSHRLVIGAQLVDHGRAEVYVEDTGCGIRPENMKKLFRPFFTTKDVGEGTGLGLAIVSQLVTEMEGEISVSSVVDQGARFTVRLLASDAT